MFTGHETGPLSIDAVMQSLDRRVGRRVEDAPGLTAVYAYEDGAAATFAAAAERGVQRIYDLPIGYWRVAHAIYKEEREREPEWLPTLTGALDSPEKLERKDEELRLAQTVIVASSFTKKTLESSPWPEKVVHNIPYGSPPAAAPTFSRPAGQPLRALFVGGLGQRKGLSYLLQALAMLPKSVHLTLLGRKTTERCRPLNEAVRSHRWIPTLSHAQVLEEMRRHDVLVFPSLFEGFGLVLLEAMSQGLPVIATPHTAAPDLIEEGREGFVVPIRSAEKIAEKLDLLASDPVLLCEMQQAAHEGALRFSWVNYRNRLAQIARSSLER